MKGLVKKGLIIGVGTTLVLRKKTNDLIDGFLKQNKVDPGEAQKVAREFFKQIEEKWHRVSDKFLCTRQIKELKQRLEKLEEELAKAKV